MNEMVLEKKTKVSKPAGMPTIDLPKGFSPTEGSVDGDEVQALVKLKLMPDGKAQIISVEGAPYEAEDESKEDPKEEAAETPDEETAEESQEPPDGAQSTDDPNMGLADKIKKLRTSMKR